MQQRPAASKRFSGLRMTGYGLLFGALNTLSAMADSEENDEPEFTEGTVAIHCKLAEAETVPKQVFNAAFPDWITDLQAYANEGKVIRAHYLPDFRSGIFIVVAGDDLAGAQANAELIIDEHHRVMQAAWTASEQTTPPGNPCELIRIGPVAILPR